MSRHLFESVFVFGLACVLSGCSASDEGALAENSAGSHAAIAASVGQAPSVSVATSASSNTLAASAAITPAAPVFALVVSRDPRLCPTPLCGGSLFASSTSARTNTSRGLT